MFFMPFFFLLLFMGGIGVLIWLACRNVAAHLRDNPEAAKALAEHVVAPILMGRKSKEEKPPEGRG